MTLYPADLTNRRRVSDLRRVLPTILPKLSRALLSHHQTDNTEAPTLTVHLDQYGNPLDEAGQQRVRDSLEAQQSTLAKVRAILFEPLDTPAYDDAVRRLARIDRPTSPNTGKPIAQGA